MCRYTNLGATFCGKKWKHSQSPTSLEAGYMDLISIGGEV